MIGHISDSRHLIDLTIKLNLFMHKKLVYNLLHLIYLQFNQIQTKHHQLVLKQMLKLQINHLNQILNPLLIVMDVFSTKFGSKKQTDIIFLVINSIMKKVTDISLSLLDTLILPIQFCH